MVLSLAQINDAENNADANFRRIKRELHEQLLAHMDLSVIGTMNDAEIRHELRRGAEELCRSQAQLMSSAERDHLISDLMDETFGLGPLEPLLKDPTVSDILINGPSNVYVERRGRLQLTEVTFHDNRHLEDIVQRIVSRSGRRVDESSPMVDTRLPDGSRVNAVVPPLALDGALVSIRRFPDRPLCAADLVRSGSCSQDMIDFLAACVQARLNIVISGGTGSGKTTLLNILTSFIPDDERVATIEDAAELRLQQPHVARMESRPANSEGKGEVTTRELLKNALRMRPDRIIVGECRGQEAYDMLQAMNTGHDGGLTTLHANTARDAIGRLEMLQALAGFDAPIWMIRRQIASAVHIVVQVNRLPGGKRKITGISEVTGFDGQVISMHDLFVFKRTGMTPRRVVQGHFTATGIRPECLKRLEETGNEVPFEHFEECHG